MLPTRAKEYGGPVFVAEAMAEQCRAAGMQVDLLPFSAGSGHSVSISKLVAAVRSSDVVHIHGLWNPRANLCAAVARHAGKPYVLSPHGMLDDWALRQGRVKKMVYSRLFEHALVERAARLHCLNADEAQQVRSFRETARSFVLPNGILLSEYEKLPNPEVLRERFPVLRGKIVALFLGRLHPKKGFDLLIPAMAPAVAASPDLHLLVVGPDQDGYRPKLEAAVAGAGLQGHVTFAGMLTGQEKLQALAGSDFFVLPSHQEGDSVAVKEAMACRLPVIVTGACHLPEVAAHEAGIVVEESVSSLAAALRRLGDDQTSRRAMGRNAYELVKGKYEWSALAASLRLLYAEVAQEAAEGARG